MNANTLELSNIRSFTRFKEKLAEFEKGLSYKNLMIDAQLKTFLSRWALNHIGEHDLKFGEYYRSKA